MNKIIQRQNDEKLLRNQYSARVCYNFAEVINGIVWGLCIISFILANITTLKNLLGSTASIVSSILSIGIFIGGDMLSAKSIKLGAAFRKYFDYNLFNIKTIDYCGYNEFQLTEKSLWICSMRKKDSAIRMKNTGNDKTKGVKDWYTGIELDPDGIALIFKCQTQNIWFDQKISQIQKFFFWMVIVTSLVIIFIVHSNIQSAIFALLPATSLIIKAIKELLSYKKFDKLMTKIEVFKDKSHIDDADIKQIQSYIDERRSMNLVSINKIHDFLSSGLHRRYSDINNL